MIKLFFFFLSSLFFFGCVSIDKYSVYTDPNGIGRVSMTVVEHKVTIGLPEGTIRDENGKIEFNDNKKKDALKAADPNNIDKFIEGHKCNSNKLYQSNVAQKKAVQKIIEKDFKSAESALLESSNYCADIGKISIHYYLEALVAKELGEIDKSIELVQKFLDYASSVEPRGFYSVDYFLEEYKTVKGIEFQNEELAFYRKQAQSYKNSESSELPLSEREKNNIVAKMYPNNPFRPGGSDTPVFFVLPVAAFSSVTGSLFGATVYKSWGKLSVFPSYAYSSDAGDLYGGTIKYNLIESANRDFDLDILASASNWKKMEYSRVDYGPVSDVKVIDTGINYAAGVGITHRFLLPTLGISAEGLGQQNTLLKQFKTYGSLYGFYDFTRNVDIFAGYLQNDPVVGFSLFFVKMGYNFDSRSIVTYLNSISF